MFDSREGMWEGAAHPVDLPLVTISIKALALIEQSMGFFTQNQIEITQISY